MNVISAIKLDGADTGLDAAAISDLKSKIRGPVLTPADADYDHTRQVWNGMIDKRPALIVRCTGVADVVEGVRFAGAHGLPVAMRCGGHNAAGHGTCDGGVMLDMTLMKGIRVDAATRRVHSQGGVLWGEFDRETEVYGLGATGGAVNDTGTVGLALGGGIGWFMGERGLTCDNIVSVDLVTADAKVITASATEHPDLFWALRGGGGNFGVVTSLEFQLYPVGQWLAGMVIYPWSKAREVMRIQRDFSRNRADQTMVFVAILTSAEGEPVIALALGHHGPIEEGERVLAPLRNIGTPLLDNIGPKSYAQVQSIFDPAGFPHGMHRYWKSSFMKDPSDTALDMVVDYVEKMPKPHSLILFYMIHGQATRVAPDATAFGLRDAYWNLDVIGQWTDPAEQERTLAWVRECWKALDKFSDGGVYVNHLGHDEPERVRDAFGQNYPRLVKVKQQYDPTNMFRFNQNIRPTA